MAEVLASGGMATVHLGRLVGAVGFARTIAVKSLRPQFVEDEEFVSMFIDEARLAARIAHPNVVPTLDVISTTDGGHREIFLVMEYVHGETLSRLLRGCRQTEAAVPLPIASAIIRDMLEGLHAAHEAVDETGTSMGVVHRDVSPQNVIVGADGVSRVLDFGVAKAAGRLQTTREGQLKGKLAYMAPEQLMGQASRQTDVFAAAIVLWELLAGKRLFVGTSEGEIVTKVLHATVAPLRAERADVSDALNAVVEKGLARDPLVRYATAHDMAQDLTRACPPADAPSVGKWVRTIAQETLDERSRLIREMESQVSSLTFMPASARPPHPSRGEVGAGTQPGEKAETRTDLSSDALLSSRRPSSHRASYLLAGGGFGVACLVVGLWIASRGGRGDPPRADAVTGHSSTTIATTAVPRAPNTTETASSAHIPASSASSKAIPWTPGTKAKPSATPSTSTTTTTARPPVVTVSKPPNLPDHI